MASLCKALDLTSAELAQALAIPAEQRYERRELPKKDGSTRIVYNPHYLIRRIQRRLNSRIFSNGAVIKWPDHIFGSVPNDPFAPVSVQAIKDYVNCARQHCGAKSILSIDIKDFFDNIHQDQVNKVFRDFLKYPEEVSKTLTDLCCMGSHLVQGALTSSYIATLCLFEVEGNVVKKLGYHNLAYTRLVDDITISSKVFRFDFGYAMRQVEAMAHYVGLPLNTEKTRIQYSSMAPLIVHGLRVDFPEPRLPPDEPRRIRAAVKNLELLAASPGYRASRAYRRDFNRCLGRVNKLSRVGHALHGTLLKRLRQIVPLPSHKDIERAEKLIGRLEADHKKQGYAEKYWFYKRCYVASERLVILARSFPHTSNDLRSRLSAIRPKKRYD